MNKTRDKFLQEAINIGDTIIAEAIKEEEGWYWMVRTFKGEQENTPFFYNGDSGTIYFLIELYKTTKEDRFLTAAVKSCERFIHNKKLYKNRNLAFYCGIGGIVFNLLEVYKITNNETYKISALSIAKNADMHCRLDADILYGSSGVVLTLLHLHNATNEDWILDVISEHISNLLDIAIFPINGICWERTGLSIRSLCGFAHGASGIAFVFLELYRYFKNEIFYKIAEMAFDYEDQYFHNNNWPDFRKELYDDTQIQNLVAFYSLDNIQEFVRPNWMSAWCHGAPGIGLARLHAYDINHSFSTTHILAAIKDTINSLGVNTRNYTLCHGLLGNAHLLLNAYIVLRNDEYYSIVTNLAYECLLDKKEHGYWISGASKNEDPADCDLLNGIVGIGHFFLRLTDAQNISNPLSLYIQEINTKVEPLQIFNDAYLYNCIFKNVFSNTYSVLGTQNIEIPNGEISRTSIKDYLEKKALKNKDILLSNAFELDTFKINLGDNIWSDAYLTIKSKVNASRFNVAKYNSLPLEELFTIKLQIDNTTHLLEQKYPNFTSYIVLQLSSSNDFVEQYSISKYLFTLLSTFTSITTVETAYNVLRMSFYKPHENLNNFNKVFTTQIKNCLISGFLSPDLFTVSYEKMQYLR